MGNKFIKGFLVGGLLTLAILVALHRTKKGVQYKECSEDGNEKIQSTGNKKNKYESYSV